MKIKILIILVLTLVVKGCPVEKDTLNPCICERSPHDGAAHITCNGLNTESDLLRVTRVCSAIKNIYAFTLANSYLNYIPSEAFKGVHFYKLEIFNSTIGALTDTDVAFRGLEEILDVLHVEDTSLMDYWDWSVIHTLKKLSFLIINGGNIEAIEKIGQTNKDELRLVSLMQNQISYIDDEAFEDCDGIRVVRLDNNQISSIRRTMFPNPAKELWQLTLKHNNIPSLPENIFFNMPALELLDLGYNKILTLQDKTFLPIWKNLEEFNMIGNEIICDCRLIWIALMPVKQFEAFCSMPTKLKGKYITDLTSRDFYFC